MFLKKIKQNLNLLTLLLLVLISLFFKSYQLESRYFFDWDQEDDALKVSDMIQNFKPRLIGPRVANESGFFVGPFHYYFLVPFYIYTQGHPIAGAYAAIAIGLLTTVIIFIITQKIFNLPTAFLATLFFATNSSNISWNVMYTPMLSLLIFYFCYQYLVHKKYFLFPWLIFTYSFAFMTHLVPISLGLPIIFTLIFTKHMPSVKQIIASIILFLIPISPLFIFDLKHNFLNLHSLINFVFSPHSASESVPFLFLRTFWRSLNLIFITNSYLITIFRIILLLAVTLEVLLTTNPKLKYLLVVWLLTPLLILTMYHGNIPEYYYGCTFVIISILFSKFIARFPSKIYILVVTLIILAIQFNYFSTPPSGITLQNKYHLVSYLVHQTTDPSFNFSYDVPPGWNTGYQYIFNYFGKEPVDTPNSHLYSVYFLSDPPKSGQIVYHDNKLGLVRK